MNIQSLIFFMSTTQSCLELLEPHYNFCIYLEKCILLGCFMKEKKASGSGLQDMIDNYSVEDLVILIYSNLIMFGLIFICKRLSKYKEIDLKQPVDVVSNVTKQNKRKKWISLLIWWIGMGYFIWSIILFTLQFLTELSYKCIFNTIVSLFIKLFLTSFLFTFLKNFFIVPVLNGIKNKRKKKIKYNQIHPALSIK